MQFPKQRLFWAVSLGHAANDMFMSMRSVLLTFISAYLLPMTSGQIGLAVSAVELSGAVSQPFFGWLADKTGGRLLGAGGVAWTVTFVCIALIVVTLGGSYWLMVIPLMLAGLGSGAFHPVGSMHATNVEPLHAGRNAAWFFMLGQLGLGIGPALAGLLVNNTLSRNHEILSAPLGPAFQDVLIERGSVMPVLILTLLAIPAVLFMARVLPSQAAYKHEHRKEESLKSASATSTPSEPLPYGALVLLVVTVALRALGSLSIVTFMPMMFQQKGWSPAEYGILTSSFWIASGIAGIWFGQLGDRHDRRRIITLSLLISVPGIFLLPGLNGIMAFVVAIVVGAMSGTHSLIVVLAQSLLPGRKGFASGLVLGLIFATGALGNLVVGNMIDHIGITTTFQIVAVVTLFASFLWLFIPTKQTSHIKAHVPHLEEAEQLV
ncbi:MAG: MFS transporter [Anaerolineae bacterium]|nr:MFS transporter [Anaerolineae bacterium]